jgi:chorismate synthase
MPGNSFGHSFRISTFGESHGAALGVVIDGVPAGFSLDLGAVQVELDRRRPGQSSLVSPRKEGDQLEVLSGIFEGRSTGAPIAMLFRNHDADSRSYAPFQHLYRPSHADYTYDAKYGFRDWRGGGRASARETVARVAAGAVARQLIAPVEIVAWVHSVGDISAPDLDPVRAEVEQNPVRCPHPESAVAMEALIRAVRAEGDTIGGVVRGVVRNVPAGLGEPVFDKLEADLGKALLSLPAAKGFESGSGYGGTRLRGSQHNDRFLQTPEGIRTRSNHSGGIQGGISNGMPITFSVAFKPVATIFQEQETVDRDGNPAILKPRGRHDPCVLPRAVPMVEAMVALVLTDHWLRQRLAR